MKPRSLLAFLPLLLLCILLSTRWMFESRWADTQSTPASQGCSAVLACALCVYLAFWKREAVQVARKESLLALVQGALLFAGVNAAQLAGAAAPRSTDIALALALTPVVILLAGAALGRNASGISGRALAPGILAPTGILLLAPEPRLTSLTGDAVLLGAPVAIGVAATWLASGRQRFTFSRAALVFAGAAVLFGMLCIAQPHAQVHVRAVVFDALIMLLLVATLALLSAREFSSQFAILPMVSYIEYLTLAQVRPMWQQTAGLLLLLVAAGILLRPQNEENGRASTVTLFAQNT